MSFKSIITAVRAAILSIVVSVKALFVKGEARIENVVKEVEAVALRVEEAMNVHNLTAEVHAAEAAAKSALAEAERAAANRAGRILLKLSDFIS